MAVIATRRYLDVTDTTSANRDQVMVRLQNALDAMETAYTNWDSLSPAQKDTAQKQALRVTAALVRLALDELADPGV